MTFCNRMTSLESRDPEIGRGVPNARVAVKINKQISRQSEEPKQISVGIFEYILASMLKVFLNI